MNASPPNTPDPLAQEDFTTTQYRELLDIAGRSYRFVRYTEIPAEERFVLWRHDVDYSLNRSLRLAEIEHEAGVAATYFVNPHCEFYNLLEKDQRRICRRLVELGHDIGLHFDAEYHDVEDEGQLDRLVAVEAALLADICGTAIKVFSFHNPTDFLLSCERDAYGGLINCYSASFKVRLAYCSDSNGYWRFRRLRDVLEQASDPRLQVLTHPGWWQESPAPPRQRIFRSVYGRANAVMRSYDRVLASHGRENLAGPAAVLQFLKPLDPELFLLCDYLWNSRETATLLLELFRMHQRCLFVLCREFACGRWGVAEDEFNPVWNRSTLADHARMFEVLFGTCLATICGTSSDHYYENQRFCQNIFMGDEARPAAEIEAVCISFCAMTRLLVDWSLTKGVVGVTDVHLLARRVIVLPPAHESNEPPSGTACIDAWKTLKQDLGF